MQALFWRRSCSASLILANAFSISPVQIQLLFSLTRWQPLFRGEAAAAVIGSRQLKNRHRQCSMHVYFSPVNFIVRAAPIPPRG
jgi:hypothetical protein